MKPIAMVTRRPKLSLLIAGSLILVGTWAFVAFRTGGSDPDRLDAERAIEDRDFPKAKVHLERYLDRKPSDTEVLLLAARTARRGHAYSDASKYLREYKRHGGDPEVVAREEQLRRVQSGNLREADHLLQSCDEAPLSPDTTFALEAVVDGSLAAFISQSQRGAGVAVGPDLDRARRAADRLLAQPLGTASQAQAHFWRARILLEAKIAHVQAVADLRKALELQPNHFDARNALTMAIAQHSPSEAREHLEILLRMKPGDIQVRYGLASLLRGMGHMDDSARMLDELLNEQPKSIDILVERAGVELDLGRPARAEGYLRRAHELNPKHGQVNRALSDCLRLLGQTEAAQRHWEVYEAAEAEVTLRKREFEFRK